MMTKNTIVAILLMVLAAVAGKLHAQEVKEPKYKRLHIAPPKVMLVQLRAEQHKIDYYVKKGNMAALTEVKDAAAQAMKTMVADFNKNFKFCPVYYFVDTNFEQIKEGKFKGLLLNKDMVVADNVSISVQDTDYYFVYYGTPQKEKMRGSEEETNMERSGNGLVINDHNYEQMQRPFPYFISNALSSNFGKAAFSSSKYSIEYHNYAGALSEQLSRFFTD